MLKLNCSICAEVCNATDDVYVTQCGHIFHYTCLCLWLNSSKTCPQCRKTCTNANIHKVFLESAVESLDNANLRAQLGAGNIQKAKQAIKDLEKALDLYEEANLNLKRELELNESNLDKCETKFICLEVEHKRVQNDLKKEIEMREKSEKKVLGLLNDNVHLTKLVQRSKHEHNRMQNDLEKEIKRRENSEKRLTELEKGNLCLTKIKHNDEQICMEKEIEMRVNSEKRVAELENDNSRLKKIVHRSEIEHEQLQNDLEMEIEMRKTCEKLVAELEVDKMRRIEMLDDLESWRGKYLLKVHPTYASGSQDATKSSIPKKEVPAVQEKCNAEDKKDQEPDALIFGIPKQPTDNVELIFRHLCDTINYIPPTLKSVFRFRQKNKTDSPIVIKFGSFEERNAFFKAKADHCKKVNRQLSPQDFGITCTPTKIYIRESIAWEDRSLLQQAICLKNNKQLFSVYTRFGSVYVKQTPNGKSIMIENEEMLNAIVAKCQPSTDNKKET